MLRKRGSILRATVGMLLILVPLALEVVGCRGGLKPVEWSELGSERKPKQSRQSTHQATFLRHEQPKPSPSPEQPHSRRRLCARSRAADSESHVPSEVTPPADFR